MNPKSGSRDLATIARQAMVDRGLEPDFPADAVEQLNGVPGPARESDDSIRAHCAQWPKNGPQLIRHVLVGDTDSFPKILGAAYEALNILSRINASIFIRTTGGLKHQLSH